MHRSIRCLALLALLLGMTACSTFAAEQTATAPAAFLTPWHTATLIPSATPTPENLPTMTLAPTLTPTPSDYTVRANDTLIVIAYRNGLTVDEILAANPGVNAYNLSIGTILKIPAAKPAAGTQMAPTPTPEPLSVGSPACYPALTGGVHCFGLVKNTGENLLENVLLEFQLNGKDADLNLSQSALLPLALLQPGESLPVYAFFEPPLPQESEITLHLLSAYRVSSTGSNSFRLEVKDPKIEIAPDGLSARVTGVAVPSNSEQVAANIRILAIAYDDNGNVIGIRTYQESASLQSGTEFKFNLLVYSTGNTIKKIEVVAEASD